MNLSVCIIAKNEEKHIEKCMQCLSDKEVQIVVADTGSTDKTKEIAKKMSEDYEQLKVISWKECKDIIDNLDQP